MGPIFNEKVAKKWNLWVHEQYMMHYLLQKSQHLRLLFIEQYMNSNRVSPKRVKKKKKKNQKRKTQTCIQTNTKKETPRRSSKEHAEAVKEEVSKLKQARAIKEAFYPDWLANIVVVKKKNGK